MSKVKKQENEIPSTGEQTVRLIQRVKLNGKFIGAGTAVKVNGSVLKRLVAEGVCERVEQVEDPLELSLGSDGDDGL
jgi:hypothetical protein